MPKIYADFGSEVQFEMVPFLMGSVDRPSCFDESSPCIEEQTAFCVFDIAQKADTSSQFPGQGKIVPWQICTDSGNSMSSCHSQVGIDSAEVEACLSDTSRIHGLMQQYIDRASNVHGTPLEEVNGKKAGSEYAAVKEAICAADPSLSACSSVEVLV